MMIALVIVNKRLSIEQLFFNFDAWGKKMYYLTWAKLIERF